MTRKNAEQGVVHDFTEGSIWKQLVVFATPLFFSNLLQITYNTVDMLVVGQYAGSAGISAVSIGGEVTNFLTVLAMGFSNAGSVIIAQLIGAGQKEKVGKCIGTLCTFLMVCAVVVAAVGLLLSKQILQWMNTPAEAWESAYAYSVICMWGLIFIYGYNIISAVLRGTGDSKHPFVFVGIATVLNIILDLVLVGALGLGAAGAAFATVIGQTVSFLVSIVFLIRNRGNLGFELTRKDFRIHDDMLVMLLKLGVPMAIKQSAVNISKLFVSSWVNSYGVVVSAVAGIGNKLNLICNLFSNSMNTAGSTIIGQNIGAERYERVPKTILSAVTITLSISAILIAVLLTWPGVVFGLFTNDPEVLERAMEFVPVAVICFISAALRAAANAFINGSANFKINFAVAILDSLVLRIGLGILFGLVMDMKYLGFWYGDAIASFTPVVIALVYYLTGTWKTRKYVVK